MHVADWLITIPAHLSATSRTRDYYRSKFTDRDRKRFFSNLVMLHLSIYSVWNIFVVELLKYVILLGIK